MNIMAGKPRRPVTLSYFDFFDALRSFRQIVATPKFDGWGIECRGDDKYYMCKSGKPLESMKGVGGAIDRYLKAQTDPIQTSHPNMKMELECYEYTVELIRFEFVCYLKSEANKSKAECLQALNSGACLNGDGSLNTVDYEFSEVIYDAFFKDPQPIEEDMARYRSKRMSIPEPMPTCEIKYEEALYAAKDCFGPSSAVESLDREGVKACLVENEGIVVRAIDGNVYKVKAPCPVSAFIVGVMNTIRNGFPAWDKVLIAVWDDRSREMSAVHEINFYDILTDYERAKQGKAYTSYKCFKRDSGGTIAHERLDGRPSTSSIVPMLNALYKVIGKQTPVAPAKAGPNRAEVKVTEGKGIVITRHPNRSFQRLNDTYQYLLNPINVILSVNDLHPIAGNADVHLQAASVLCIPDVEYGPCDKFRGMPPTTKEMLMKAALDRLCRDRYAYYDLVGASRSVLDLIDTADLKRTLDPSEPKTFK